MANKNSIPERLTRVEEGVKYISTQVTGLVNMINPKTEVWNNTANDVKWLKKFFWVIFIALCGVIIEKVVRG